MLVAISQRREGLHRVSDTLESSYAEYFAKFGINLIPIPNIGKRIKKYFKEIDFDGVILSGGGDVHPKLYSGDTNYPGNYSTERDDTEKVMLDIALEQNLPILGICRGMEQINVHFGGKLIQSIERDIENAVNHVGTKHDILILDKAIRKGLGTNTVRVNSFHDQGIDREQLSTELLPFATAPDQSIEGLYHPKHALAGIMWHPERASKIASIDKLLTRSFVSGDLFWKKTK